MTTMDIVGYLGSALILASFAMNNMRLLRIINTLGCGTFIIYGAMLMSIPIIVTNSAIFVLNIYYLLRKKRN